jgi:hypothetical protein
MLAAQMQNSADKAMAAVSVIVMAARPVAVVRKMLEHQVEQLHRLCDFLFRHGLTAPILGDGKSLSPAVAIRIAARLR